MKEDTWGGRDGGEGREGVRTDLTVGVARLATLHVCILVMVVVVV